MSRLRPSAPLRSRVLSPPVRGLPPSAAVSRLQRPRIHSATRSLPPLRRGRRTASACGRVVLLLLGLLAGCGTGGGGDAGPEAVDRVLIVTLPGVGWSDLRDARMPNLAAFVDDAAVGDVSTRIGRHDASTTEAYLTLSAGTRAVAPLVDTAVAVDRDETYGGVPTAEILERRLGYVPAGIAYLGMGAAVDANDNSEFGADVGTLGDALFKSRIESGQGFLTLAQFEILLVQRVAMLL